MPAHVQALLSDVQELKRDLETMDKRLVAIEDVIKTLQESPTRGDVGELKRDFGIMNQRLVAMEKALTATKIAGHTDCYRSVPPPDEKDGSKDGGWATEVESTLKYKVQRIYRRELSILQQRAEEAFYEGRVKNSIDLEKEAQALVADKPKLILVGAPNA